MIHFVTLPIGCGPSATVQLELARSVVEVLVKFEIELDSFWWCCFLCDVDDMAEGRVRISMVPLNGSNYATWKVQAKMTMLKDGLWRIVGGTETEPTGNDATPAAVTKFAGRHDQALATLVLSVDTSLLYLIADLDHPNKVWTKLSD